MYSWEIEDYLRKRNYSLTRDEYFKLTPKNCPQICRCLFDSGSNKFFIYTTDDYVFEFEVKNN